MPLTQPDGDNEDNSGNGTDSDNGSVNADVEDITQRQYQDHILRYTRQMKEPKKFHDFVLLTQGTSATYDEAMNYKDGAKWKAAMAAEMQSLMESGAQHLVELPEGRKAINNNRWVMRVKLNPDGNIDRYKARLVAIGCSQKAGIDFDETCSPVAWFDAVRIMLSVAANERLKLAQFDVKTAFLIEEIEEETYRKQPDGYDDGTTRVCRVLKSPYGLKQSTRCLNRHLVDFMKKNNFVTSNADPCLFVRQSDTLKSIVAIYVDDELIAGNNHVEIQQFLKLLMEEFKITIGSTECFLGMQMMKISDRSIFMHQESCTLRMLSNFGMADAKHVQLPLERQNSDTSESCAM